jgi:polysaccharide biosynthesis/export protein
MILHPAPERPPRELHAPRSNRNFRLSSTSPAAYCPPGTALNIAIRLAALQLANLRSPRRDTRRRDIKIRDITLRDITRLAFLFIAAFWSSGPAGWSPREAVAQTLSSGSSTSTTTNPLDLIRRRLGESTVVSSLLPMEGVIDENEYSVGPGDFFTIVIGSIQGSSAAIPVSADGRLLLPEAGSVEVGGLTLAEARQKALSALRQAFGQVPVDVSLSRPRQFYVHVSGAVPVPGRYLSLPLGRVSSALALAFSDTSRAAVTNPRFRPSMRNVSVVHQDGTEEHLDLLQYFSAGQISQNPYLQDGDVVFVPGYDPAYQSVQVDGSVPFPGEYDIRPNDVLRSVLRAAGLTEAIPHVERVRVVRTGEDGRATMLFIPMSEAFGTRGSEFSIQARDHISITPENPPGGTATVEGWVRYPGTYAIEEGRLTLRDLVERAGGLREGAIASAAYLERRALPQAKPTILPEGRLLPEPDFSALIKADTMAILQQLRLTDLDFLSRSYFAQELRTQNRVSVDLAAVLAGNGDTGNSDTGRSDTDRSDTGNGDTGRSDTVQRDAPPVLLRDGDRLVVPRDEQTVFIAGQVIRPGFVLHSEGQQPEHYIEAAGGRSGFASDVYLLRRGTGEFVLATNAIVMSGDVIFVDRKEDLAENAEMQRLVIAEQSARADARIRVAQTIVQSIGTLATLVALVVSLSR